MTRHPARAGGWARGLTLLETIVVIGLFAFMMIALTGLYLSFSTSATTQQALTEANTRALKILALMHEDIASADAVLASHTFDSSNTYESATTTLAIELPAIDSSGTAISGSYDYIAYYLSGTEVYRELNAAGGSSRVSGTTLIATGVSRLELTYDDPDAVNVRSVSLDLVVTAGVRKPVTHEVRDTTSLRNHS